MGSWGRYAIDVRNEFRVNCLMSTSSNFIVPVEGSLSLNKVSIKVDLPLPDAPTRTVSFPFWNFKTQVLYGKLFFVWITITQVGYVYNVFKFEKFLSSGVKFSVFK